ncbi:MAG: hypothetical protein ACYCZR_02145 [Burkholderiales bacterium]
MNDQIQTSSMTPTGAASRAEGANLTAGLCGDDRGELEMLRIWKADALERIEDDERAYKEQGEMLVKMHGILNKVADMLFDARKELASVIELKDEYAETVKRTKRVTRKPHNK